MTKVLFVCLGNICRSPLAEGVFRAFLHENQFFDIQVDSAGTAGYHIGSQPDKRSVKTALRHKISLDHFGRKLEKSDLVAFDFIVAMDKVNYKDINNLATQVANPKAKVVMMREFDPLGTGDVPDPYYGDMDDFEAVYEICLRSCPGLLKFIKNS